MAFCIQKIAWSSKVNFNIDFKTIKELMMQYGFFTVAITLTLCSLVLILAIRLPAIIIALAEFKARKGDE